MNPRKLIAVTIAILMASASAFAAVKNGASLKGNEYTKGGNNAKGGGVIAWNSYSSLDPTAFGHDLSSSDLTVLKDGDYLVAVTVPISTIKSQRNTHRAELLVNGTAVSTAVGESSYIRLADGHNESSDHFAVLVALKANDLLTVKTTPTAQTGGESFIGTCSLYAELVEGNRNVFSASATEIQSGVELNVEPDTGDQGLVWTSARKGSAYTHSDGDADITIKDDGNYMVYVNVPLRGKVVRASVGLTLNLDDEYIKGARGQQGYIRNANSHEDTSIHFSGMIRAEAGQVLTVITEQLAAAGSINVQANRAASIFIEKVRNDGIFSDSFTGTTAGENLNPNNKTALSLVGDGISLDIIDNTTYANEGDNEENIVIKKAGSYLLSFNSTFTGGNARANPRVTVEVNGSVVPGATSLSHYNRHNSGHDEVTGSFVALLSDLAVDDVVTVSVQRESNGGTVTSPEGGKVALQAKATYETAAGDQSPPRFSSFSGGLDGFSAIVEGFRLKLDAATLKATLNGEVVAVTVDSANGVNTINYAFETFPSSGSKHALNIAFNDTGGNAHSMDFAFTVTAEYQTVSPAFSMSDVNKDKGGFRVNMTQISTMQTEGPNNVHNNLWVNAEKQLRGEYLNPNDVDDDDNPLPYLNEADPDAWEGWSIAPADVDYVNMNQDEDGNIGNFGGDQMFPNIPGWGNSTDGIAGEFLTVLHLKRGFQTLGVNSDDGFRATVGLNFHDMEAQQIGLFDGSRGAADSLFNIVVTEEGYYPLRVSWWEGGGGANIEIFSIADGKKVLVNDPDNENAIKAYNIGNSTGRTYFGSVSPTPDDTFATENSISATIIADGTKAKSGSIKVLLNGEEVDASVKSADGVVTITAEPDGGIGIGSHTAKIVFTETTDPETERSFEWSFEVTAFSNMMRDLVDGQPNPIAYWDFDFADVPDLTFEHVFNLESVMTNAKYTEDKGGHTGETGDYAMDFLQEAANLLVPDGEFLNIASAFDKISVSLWQKNHTTPNSSSFWGYSPSSNDGFRGIQAHIPWSNQQIYFDTAGCCGGTTQRINLAVDPDYEWTEWHHYVFVKDKGHKSIWIDGTLVHEGDNSLVLPSDFDFLYIGSNGNGGNSVSGIIDDFAVFASALTEEQIIALSEGNTDILPEKREIEVPQPELTLSEADMKYDAQSASITLDGDASDWADLEFKSQIPFEKGGELVLFEEYGGGTWSGPADHSSAVAFAWDASNLYIGVVITDDTHQNGGSGWNGDSIQMVFANAAQDTVTQLYNYGLSDDGAVVIMNEKGDGGTEASITRDDDTTTTLYEFAFPAASLGLDAYESGMSIGVGVCVNDGDTQDGQGGQKGWSGWGPYSAVYGKTAGATGLVSLVGEAPGVDLTLSEADMKYDAQSASITLDGDASDWADLEFKSQIPFEKGGELVLFEEYGGGTWSGPADHSSAVAFAWDASNLYIGVVITDDTHQNGGSGWNGDSIQMVFANAAQDTVTQLYNYGLSDDGAVVIMNEKGDGGTEASITRDDDTTTTLYEFAFPAASLGLDAYESGMSIGVGVCVNDGDTQDGQGGQKGWSGWGPYAAVYGKTASATGLVTLVGEPVGAGALILIDFGGTAPNSAGASPDPWVTIDNLVMDEAASLGDGVTITALDDGFNPNNPAQPGEGAEYDGVSVPQEARNDYFFKIADAAGTTARMRIDGLAAGTYNVTVFEGRTTDASQFAKIWSGEESTAENTGDFAKGSATVTVTVAAGEPLWYMHLEDGSGGVSGMMIRQASDTPALSIVNNGDGTVTVTYTGTLQAAPAVNGPWEDVEGATSPLTTPADAPATFARTRN